VNCHVEIAAFLSRILKLIMKCGDSIHITTVSFMPPAQIVKPEMNIPSVHSVC